MPQREPISYKKRHVAIESDPPNSCINAGLDHGEGAISAEFSVKKSVVIYLFSIWRRGVLDNEIFFNWWPASKDLNPSQVSSFIK
jgi:hypothetical protein